MITMYYDDKCAICYALARHTKAKNPDEIRIVAVSQAVDELAGFGVSELEAMTYLYVQDDNKKMHKGMGAVRLLYQTARLPMAKVLALPLIKQIGDVIYPVFARNRYRMPRWLLRLLAGKEAMDDAVCESESCRLPPKERLK